jgi:hypothetical protein
MKISELGNRSGLRQAAEVATAMQHSQDDHKFAVLNPVDHEVLIGDETA